MKYTIFLLPACLFLFFSCQSTEQKPREILSPQMLHEKLLDMDVYHQWIASREDLEKRIDEKRRQVDKKDHWWIINIHNQYPQMEDFLAKAPLTSINKYKLLTGIDLQRTNPGFLVFLQKILDNLNERYEFQVTDLNQLLFLAQDRQMRGRELLKNNCVRFCQNEANHEFERVMASCDRNNLLYCQHRALLARYYFERGCLAGCNYPEE